MLFGRSTVRAGYGVSMASSSESGGLVAGTRQEAMGLAVAGYSGTKTYPLP